MLLSGSSGQARVSRGSGLADILLDSDVIIAWLRGYQPVAGAVIGLLEQGHNLLWTPVSVAEIFAGARKSESARLETLFQVLETLPISKTIGKTAGHYLQKYSKSHSLELGDALIAASARVADLSLWTINKKHYPMREIRLFTPATYRLPSALPRSAAENEP
jgi:predicted nucleic acid-binding protein